MTLKKYQSRNAKPRNNLPDISMMLRPLHGKDVRIARFYGQYYRALENMGKHYWHSNYFSDITFAPVTSTEALRHVMFDESLANYIFSSPRLNLGLYVRTSEGIYFNPGNAVKTLPVEFGVPEINLDLEELTNLKNKSVKVNDIYLGENDFSFAPWETFRTSKNNFDEIPALEFAKGGFARALEHSYQEIAPTFFKIVDSCIYKQVSMEYWVVPKIPIVGEVRIGYEHGRNWYFEITGNSYNDNNHLRKNPDKSFYWTIENAGQLIGKLATNRGKPINYLEKMKGGIS
jgi:hypothetical protein